MSTLSRFGTMRKILEVDVYCYMTMWLYLLSQNLNMVKIVNFRQKQGESWVPCLFELHSNTVSKKKKTTNPNQKDKKAGPLSNSTTYRGKSIQTALVSTSSILGDIIGWPLTKCRSSHRKPETKLATNLNWKKNPWLEYTTGKSRPWEQVHRLKASTAPNRTLAQFN